MDLKGIISISGMSGLYKVVAQSKNGFIVESLIDKKRIPAYSSYRISTIEEISMYSTGDDVPLKDVLQKIVDKEKGGQAIDPKSADAEIKKYFEGVFPEYDKDRVHMSDIKKVLGWYNLLQKNDLLKKEESKEGEEDKAAKVLASAKDESGIAKPKKAAVKVKSGKTSAGNVKTQGVRKSGTA